MLLSKDFLSEFRDKLNFVYYLILSPAISLIFYIFNDSQNPLYLYFLTILIINFITNQRISRQEISSQGELILINMPLDLSVFCLSKIIFTFLLNFVISFITIAVFMLLAGGLFFENTNNFIIFSRYFILF